MKPQQIEKKILILVEGKDAYNFFEVLVGHLGLDNVGVKNFGGINQLTTYLAGLVSAPGFRNLTKIGIIRDAETSDVPEATEARAFQSVQSSLTSVGLSAPSRPSEYTERAPEGPAIAVLVLPGNGREGMLETLLCETFAGTPIDRCVADFLRCVEESDELIYRPDKARTHAYLATKPDPHVSVGVAAQKGYWDLDHAALDGVRGFLASLQGGAA